MDFQGVASRSRTPPPTPRRARLMTDQCAQMFDDGAPSEARARPRGDGQAVRLRGREPLRRPLPAGLRRPRLHAHEHRRALLARAARRPHLGGHERDPAADRGQRPGQARGRAGAAWRRRSSRPLPWPSSALRSGLGRTAARCCSTSPGCGFRDACSWSIRGARRCTASGRIRRSTTCPRFPRRSSSRCRPRMRRTWSDARPRWGAAARWCSRPGSRRHTTATCRNGSWPPRGRCPYAAERQRDRLAARSRCAVGRRARRRPGGPGRAWISQSGQRRGERAGGAAWSGAAPGRVLREPGRARRPRTSSARSPSATGVRSRRAVRRGRRRRRALVRGTRALRAGRRARRGAEGGDVSGGPRGRRGPHGRARGRPARLPRTGSRSAAPHGRRTRTTCSRSRRRSRGRDAPGAAATRAWPTMPPSGGDPRVADPAPPRGLAVMTCSGGDSAIAADLAATLGVDLPALSPATVARLERHAFPTRRPPPIRSTTPRCSGTTRTRCAS